MVKKHLSRHKAPKVWPISTKERRWIARPLPGPHKLKNCITLNLLLKNIMKQAKTTRDVKKILNDKKILIDNKPRKDYRLPLGLMDTISVPELDEYYRLFIDEKGKFFLLPLKKEEANIKPYKIIGKKILKNKKIQLNLYDGKNLLVDKNDYQVGDTILLDLSKNKITTHIKFDKGNLIFLTGGKHIGRVGVLEDINKQLGIIKIKIKDDKFDTSKEYAFVIGEKHPVITLR